MNTFSILFTFLLIHFVTFVDAQTPPPTEFDNQISFTPFATYDSENPSLRISYERKFTLNKSILLQGGWIYPLYNRSQIKDVKSENFGYLIASEFRQYWSTKSNGNFYSGIRASLLHSDLAKVFWFDTSGTNIQNFRYPTRQEKQIFGAQLVGGLSFTVTQHFVIDMEIGIGTSYRIIKNNVPVHFENLLFDRNIRAAVSNKEYDNWFTPFPYFQIHVGYAW